MASRYIEEKELREWVQNWFEKNRYYHPYSKSNDIPIPELYDILEQMPSADVVEKFIDELTREISDRVIQALEANYEIIPKKPVVRCKDCVHRHQTTCPFLIANAYKASSDDDFCSRGERRENE